MINKKEFDLKKELLELEHRYKMEEIEFKFQKELELQRIKTAEIKRTIERKKDLNFMNSYVK